MPQSIQNQLQARIEAFASDLTAILQRAVADSVNQALATGRKGAGSAGRGGRLPRVDFSEDALLREIKREGGRRMEELSAALKAPSRSLKGPIKRLLAAKKIKTAGKARGTKYSAL